MKRRQQSIIYHLAIGGGSMTADDLARHLAVSTRTIKSEMVEVRKELKEVGAVLHAKRNKGYSIVVTDDSKFQQFFEVLSIQSALVNNFAADDDVCFLYIARKLVSSSRFVKLDDIADELFISKSALRSSIKSVMEFLGSYHLIIESKPGLGIRTFGTEHHMRLAMTELFAVHFHRVLLNNAGMEYAKWTACDHEERQSIRHCFLSILRKAPIKILDMNTQRLAIYFIIVRNRCKAGYRLQLPIQWQKEIQQYEEYRTAEAIFEGLKSEFSDFDLPEQETVFLAICLIYYRDIENPKDTYLQYPQMSKKAEKLTKELIEYMKEVYQLNLLEFEWVYDELCSILAVALAEIHFEFDGLKRFELSFENSIMKSPAAVELAFEIMEYLEKRLGMQLSATICFKLTALIYKIVSHEQYDIQKMKLLLVNFGSFSLNEVIKMRVLNRYERLIESCTFVELYEIRGLNQQDYDAVLIDANNVIYNYDLPYCAIHILPNKTEMNSLYNNILIHAFQTRELLPVSEQIIVYDDFNYKGEIQFLRTISSRYSKDENISQTMLERLDKRRKNFSIFSETAILFYRSSEKEKVELYCLNNVGLWNGEEISHILYLQISWNFSWKKVKVMENALRQMLSNQQFIIRFKQEKELLLQEMVEHCLKYE